jgi:hypothetical protein
VQAKNKLPGAKPTSLAMSINS